ncbi:MULTISPECIES: GH25 family lysozyme [Micromonospora]|uniref:Lysozyme n=2 Tax=Micromonospora TaxID=1873 RepID=A0A9X0I768_9ACTN|nr:MULTISPECIES: GH25 family lysozyme [Micromonospora]AEB42901.1 lysozyme [Micromonospora maris AB-18-032]KUJ48298.1 hydrolase [Micromonospora maris]PMR57931.1 hydrolase [Verrucosispora sp. ts21]GIJ13991.1 hydrolase [Micromonospora gifhornensis]
MSQVRSSLRRLTAAALTVLATAAAGLVATATPAAAATVPGIDVSRYQGTINWTSVRNAGIQFAFIKATEGTSYKDPNFNTNYVNAYNAGVIRGAYHFARPNISSGAVQANYLASNGGAWSADSRTLPAALDLEANPYSGGYCYGLSTTAMRNWVQDFLNTYRSRTGRYAVIYTTTSFWNQCTGSWSGPWNNHPLWIARWSSSVGALPAGAPFWSFWQYTDSGSVPGISGAVDRNYWNGDRSRLIALANNT